MGRAAIAILSTENLLHNLAMLKQVSNHKPIMAMIKANAYGHGLRSVASRLEGQVQSFGVASIDEAMALRKAGIKSPITLIEGVFEPDELLLASTQGFHVVFHEAQQINWLEKSTLPRPLTCWLKIDTGMGRLGFMPEQAQEIYQRLAQNPHVAQPCHVISHFACADVPQHPLNQQQIQRFQSFVKDCAGLKSLANSAAVFNFPQAHFDVIRPGIALYGISPLPDKTAAELNLRPVMTLQTRLIAVRHMTRGASIGYGSEYICPEDMLVGVFAMGYGDGYPRSARRGTPLLVNGVRCQLVGRVSMDMATVDLRACPQAKTGDPVVLWGQQLPIEEVASYTAQIPYDLLTGVQQRVKFFWTIN